MRAVPINDDEVKPGTQRIVLGGPGGDLTGESGIAPLELLVWLTDEYVPIHASKWQLEEGDLELLIAGEPIWLVVMVAPGGHPPVLINAGDIERWTK